MASRSTKARRSPTGGSHLAASRNPAARRNLTARRPRGPALGAVVCAVILGGCAPLDFGAHASFDSWFVGSADSVHLEEWGILALDGGPGGYLVNDILIRTPALIVQDVACLLLVPVALPYYWIGSLTGGGDSPATTPAGQAEPAHGPVPLPAPAPAPAPAPRP